MIRSFYDQTTYMSIYINQAFTVTDEGVLVVNGQPQSSLLVQLPGETLKGQLFNNGKVLANADMSIGLKTDEYSYEMHTIKSDENGYFVDRLPDGQYQIRYVAVNNVNYLNKSISFEVVKGVPSLDFSQFDIGLVYGNVIGK